MVTIKKNSFLIKILFFLPIAYGFLQIYFFGVNVPFWDGWEIIRLLDDFQTNGISFSGLFSQHNEHRILFPKIVLLLSGMATNWNVKFQMYLSQLLVSISYVVCFLNLRNAYPEDVSFRKKQIIACLFIGAFCFNSSYCELFLWGFAISVIMVGTATVFGLFSFQKYFSSGSSKQLIICVICAVVASFSSAQGLFLWVVCFALFILTFISKESSKPTLKVMAVFTFAGIACILLYFVNFHFIEGHDSLKAHTFPEILGYFFLMIGGKYFSGNPILMFVLGLIEFIFSLIITVLLIKKKKIKENIFPLGMIYYGYAFAGSLAIGRGANGIYGLVASRYLSLCSFSAIGIIIILYKIVPQKGLPKFSYNLLIALCVISCFITNINGILVEKEMYSSRKRAQYNLQNYQYVSLSDLNTTLYPWTTYEDAYATIQLLVERNYNVFEMGKFPAYGEISTFEKDRMAQMQRIQYDQPIGFDENSITCDSEFLSLGQSWIADFISGKEYKDVYVRVNGNLYYTVNKIDRPDVAQIFNNSNFEYSGFQFLYPLDKLLPDKNYLSIVMLLDDGVSYYESSDFVFSYDATNNLIYDVVRE